MVEKYQENKKVKRQSMVLPVIFIIWGSIVLLIGVFLSLLVVFLMLESADSLVAFFVLQAMIWGITFLLGLLPAIAGIRRIKKNRATNSPEVQKKVAIERTETRILCRDKQYDNGSIPLLILLLKCVVVTIIPLALAIFASGLIAKSVGYRILPGTFQAWASLFLVAGGSVLAILGLLWCGRNNAMGNKFYYYIIDEKDGLSFAHMGRDRLAYYVKKQASLSEKVKSAPSFLYVLIYLFSIHSRVLAYQLAQMEMYFRINKKHHFVEELLLGEDYAGFCEKIVAVRKIRYFSKGCEVRLVFLKDGVEQETKQIIYRHTTHYDLLMSKLKALEPEARKGDELSHLHVKQIRRNICRRVGITMLTLLCMAFVIVGSFRLYLTASYKVSVWEPGVFSMLEKRLAYRSRRRLGGAVYFVIFTVLAGLAKMLTDAFRPHVFTCVSVQVESYYEKKGSFIKKIEGDYKYFAKVRYGNGTVDVGLHKDMWIKKENVKPLLVLRKNIPYCLIYQDTEKGI